MWPCKSPLSRQRALARPLCKRRSPGHMTRVEGGNMAFGNPDDDTWVCTFRDGSRLSGMERGRKVRYPSERRHDVTIFAVGGFALHSAPLDYRKRVKLPWRGPVRWCHILIYQDSIVWIHDNGVILATDGFLGGDEWYYPIS